MSKPVAVVTGAGSGIGAAIARELAVRDHLVVVTDIDGESATAVARELGGESWASALDVTDAEAVQALADVVVARHQQLDVWVSNAGISHMDRFVDVSEADLDRTLAINLKGIFLCGQAAARTMQKLGNGGVIINTASMASKQGRVAIPVGLRRFEVRRARLTQAMAFELAADSIRVNCVCPGYVATSMQNRELAWEASLRGISVDEVRQLYIDDTPLRRLEQPEDVARAVAFLASHDAAFITGEAVAINGGAFMD